MVPQITNNIQNAMLFIIIPLYKIIILTAFAVYEGLFHPL